MARDPLTGSRIRQRRTAQGIKQSMLASEAGISASYLNLIEHNRRRIGGKILLSIARALDVEPTALTEGTEGTLLTALREAAARAPDAPAELERIDEFAGRFPGWADVVARLHGRITGLERMVEALNDRLAHDPQLATALHEMLSMVTAIRSTAGILADAPDIEAEWRARFHRNINEDALRLAESSRALVKYLEADESMTGSNSPDEEVEAFLNARGFHIPALEAGGPDVIDAEIGDAAELISRSGQDLARRVLRRYADMAVCLPADAVRAHIEAHGLDPAHLAAAFNAPVRHALLRLATLGDLPGDLGSERSVGVVICDAAGQMIFRKPIDHFPLPRGGAACALWPLFSAFSRPGQPMRIVVEQSAREIRSFETYSVAEPVVPPRLDEAPRMESAMLMRPLPEIAPGAQPIGVSCRICSRYDCPARREPSLLDSAE